MFARSRILRKFFFVLSGMIGLLFFYATLNQTNFNSVWLQEWIVWPDFYLEDQLDPLNSYVKIHQNILSGRWQPRVVFNGEIRPGYANKIYGVLSSMVTAVLTDSALIIRWKSVENYIEPPLPRSFDRFENTSFFSQNFKPLEIVNLPGGTQSSWASTKKLSYFNYALPKADRLRYQSNSAFFFEICANPRYFDKLLSYNLTTLDTVIKANRSLSNTNINNTAMSEAERVESVLSVGFQVATRLLNKFWRPRRVIQKVIDNYVRTQFAGFFMIGIHLRYQYLSDQDIMLFAECALQIENQMSSENKKKVKWYVSSDSWKVLTILEKKFKEKIIFGEGKLGHTTHFPDTYSRTILDNELLSKCDEIIVTGGSSFGFVAALKAGRLPYFIEGRRRKPPNSNETITSSSTMKCERMLLNRPPSNHLGVALF